MTQALQPISQCASCLCMTKTIDKLCGKCKKPKAESTMYHGKESHPVGEECPICRPKDPKGDAFIEFMESQGIKFIDTPIKKKKPCIINAVRSFNKNEGCPECVVTEI